MQFEGKTCGIAATFSDSCLNAASFLCGSDCVAEGEGFEPPVPFPVQWFSRCTLPLRAQPSQSFTGGEMWLFFGVASSHSALDVLRFVLRRKSHDLGNASILVNSCCPSLLKGFGLGCSFHPCPSCALRGRDLPTSRCRHRSLARLRTRRHRNNILRAHFCPTQLLGGRNLLTSGRRKPSAGSRMDLSSAHLAEN